MAQIFSPRSNTLARVGIAGVIFLVIAAGWTTNAIFWSPYMTYAKVPREQPVPFSHKHHVAGLGIDCRYCHTSVEKSSLAGLPPTETCMTCHSQVWRDAPVLEPVRASLRENKPLQWNRVYDLPDFVYFNHSIHVNRGIGCATCHGPVDQMPLTWKENTLYMKWCVDCHKHPENNMLPREQVFNMLYNKPADQKKFGTELALRYHVNAPQLIDCTVCHR